MRVLLLLAAIAAVAPVAALSTNSMVQEPLELDSPALREAKAEAEMAREALQQARQQAEEARTAYQELLASANSSSTSSSSAAAAPSPAEELVAARKAVQTARDQYSAFVNKEVEDKVEETEHTSGSALTVAQAEAEVAAASKEVLQARAAYNKVLAGQVPEEPEGTETIAQAISREAAERKKRAQMPTSVESTEKGNENAKETYEAFREEAVNALNYMKAKVELQKLKSQYEGLTHQPAAPGASYKEEYELLRSQAKSDVDAYLAAHNKHGASPMNLLASSSSIVDTKSTSAHDKVASMRKEAQEALSEAKQRSSTIGLLSTSSKTTPTNFDTMSPHEQVAFLRTDALAAMKEYEEAKHTKELAAQSKANTFTRAGQLNTVSALLGNDLPDKEETQKISHFLSSQVNQVHDYATKRFLEKVVSGLQTAAAHEDASVHVDVSVKTPAATNTTRVVEQNPVAAASNHDNDLLESTNYVGTGLIIGCSVGVVAGMAITRFVLMKL